MHRTGRLPIRRRLRPGLVGLTVFALAAIAYAARVSAQPQLPYFQPTNGERILYLASGPLTADTDLAVPVKELLAEGVTIVYNFSDLKSLADAAGESAEAIIIHQSRIQA